MYLTIEGHMNCFQSSMVFFFFFFFLFRAVAMAYGGSQARGLIGAAATGLHHSHSNAGSKPHLQHSSQEHQILNPLSEARESNLCPHGY